MERFGLNDQKKKIILGILLALGIIFLLLSEYDFSRADEETVQGLDEEAYVARLETRLSEMIGRINGISDVNVMITLEKGEEYRYAKEASSQSLSSSDLTHAFRLQTDSDGTEAPILIATLSPVVKGVSVVCRGAEDAVMQNKVISLVASTLNLNRNQIYVTT